MPACPVCGTADEFLYRCPYCADRFCEEHIQAEAHNCPEASPAPDEARTKQTTSTKSSSSVEASGEATDKPVQDRSIEEVLEHPRVQKVLVALIVVALLLGVGVAGILTSPQLLGLPFGSGDPGNPGSHSLNESEVERLVITEINDRRTDAGVSQVRPNGTLGAIAAYHSRDMAEYNYTAHLSPDGETVIDRYNRFDYECELVGELVVHTYYRRDSELGTATAVFESQSELATGIVEAWMQSPPRRAVLMNESWSYIGVGVAKTDSQKVYVTANFCG